MKNGKDHTEDKDNNNTNNKKGSDVELSLMAEKILLYESLFFFVMLCLQ